MLNKKASATKMQMTQSFIRKSLINLINLSIDILL